MEHTDGNITIITAMAAMCHRPKMYTRDGTVRQLVEYLDNDEGPMIMSVGRERWDRFNDEVLHRLDFDAMTPLQLLEVWQKWSGE